MTLLASNLALSKDKVQAVETLALYTRESFGSIVLINCMKNIGSRKLNNSILWYMLAFLHLLNIKTIYAQNSLETHYNLNASGTFKEGRLNQIILPLSGNYILTSTKWKIALTANFRFLKTNGRQAENELLSRLLVSFFPKKRWFPILGYSFSTSELYQLKTRHAPGLGVGWKIFQHPKSSLYLYGWGAYDNTEFKNISGYLTFRLNSMMVGRHELVKDKLSLEYLVFYLQSLETSNNYLWRIEPKLLFHLAKNFSISFNITSHFENIVDPTNTKRNSVLTVGFQYQNNR